MLGGQSHSDRGGDGRRHLGNCKNGLSHGNTVKLCGQSHQGHNSEGNVYK